MFLNLLNEDQKATFLGIALKLVRADGRIVDEEFSLMSAVQTELGWDVQPDVWALDQLDTLEQFDDRRSRMVVMMELYLLAVCDGALPPEEVEIFDVLARSFGMDDETQAEALNWARQIAPVAVQGWRMALSGQGGHAMGPACIGDDV
ncbi:MAG: hypothetical protein ACPGOV_10720 [Magnetovibrionaceae bacterium]